MCCSVLLCVAVCCNALQRNTAMLVYGGSSELQVCCRCVAGVLQCVAVCYCVLQCIRVWRSVLWCVVMCCRFVLQVCYSVLLCVVVCCNVQLNVAMLVYSSELQVCCSVG